MLAGRGRCARLHVEQNYSKTRHMQILHGVIARAAASVQSPTAGVADTVREAIGATRRVKESAI